jgi:hypothetical protein
MYKGELNEILLQRLNRSQNEKKQPNDPSFPPLHWGDRVHRIGFVGDIGHRLFGPVA